MNKNFDYPAQCAREEPQMGVGKGCEPRWRINESEAMEDD